MSTSLENPGLVRWMLLLGQWENEYSEKGYMKCASISSDKNIEVYVHLVPMRTHGENSQANENGA